MAETLSKRKRLKLTDSGELANLKQDKLKSMPKCTNHQKLKTKTKILKAAKEKTNYI